MALGIFKALSSIGGDSEIMDTWVKGDRVYYEMEIDTILGESMAKFRSRLALALDLPLRWAEVEKIEKLARGVIVKAWKVTLSYNRKLSESEDDE